MRHSWVALALLGLPPAAPVPAADRTPTAASTAARAPIDAYTDFVKAVQVGNPTYAGQFLPDEALAQLRALPEQGRRQAIRALAGPFDGTAALKVVDQNVTGETAVLSVESSVGTPYGRTTIAGTVELVRLARGWVVRSETWTVGGQTWSGLRTPGVFPPEAVVIDPLGWATKDVRRVISAEAAYQGANQGYYGTPACLGREDGCIPGYPLRKDGYLSPTLASLATKDGFRRRFDAGLPAPPGVDSISPSSLTSYAYWLIPDTPEAGNIARCGDDTGIICDMPDATAPATEGRCPVEKGCVPVH